MEIEEKKLIITTNKNNEMELYLRNYNNEELSISLFTINQIPSKKFELKCNLEEFQKNRFFKIFFNVEEIMKELENKIENQKSMFIEDTNCIIIEIEIGLTIINEVLLVVEEKEKNKDDIIEELKKNKKKLEKIIKELKGKLKDAENKLKINEKKEEPEINNIQNNNLVKENNIFESFSSKLLCGSEKKFYITNESIDIGTYLKHMKIDIYDRVIINIKEGNYFWNEYFCTPENVYLYFVYDKYDCHSKGKNNKVKIIIDKPTKPCQSCTDNNHVSFIKLKINRDAIVEFRMIDFIENIEINNNLCGGGQAISVFSLVGDNSRFYLLRSDCYISCSPFINVEYINFGKIFFGHTHFNKNEKCDKNKIFVVAADRGWGWGGKAYIYCGVSTTYDNFCLLYDEKNKKIECYKDE